MATEASLPHDTADVQVEEKSVSDEIKIADEKSDFEPKEIEGKPDEEKTVTEELANSATPITETENKEADETDAAVVKEMKKGDEDNKPSEADVSAGDTLDNPLQGSGTADVSEPVAEGGEREPNTTQDELGTPEPPTEALKEPAEDQGLPSAPGAEPEAAVSESLTEETKNEPAVLESGTQVATNEPAILIESLTEETTNEPAVSEPVTEEASKEPPLSETVIEEATNKQPVAETLAATVAAKEETINEPTVAEIVTEETSNGPAISETVTAETSNGLAISETATEEVKSVAEPAEVATPPVSAAETGEKQEPPEVTGGTGEVKSVEEPAEIAAPLVSVAETEEKQEPLEVTGGTEPGIDTDENPAASKLVEVPQEEKAIDSATTVEEAVAPIGPAAVVVEDAGAAELKETGAEAVVSEVVDAPKDESDAHAGKRLEEEKVKEETEVVLAAASEPVKREVAETLKPEAEEEGKGDEAAEVEEPPLSEAVKTVASAEVAAASTDVEKAPVEVETVEKKTEECLREGTETSRDLIVKADPALKAGEPAGGEQEETEKAEDKNADASAKDEGDTKAEVEAPKEEAPPKPSQRQSSNIIAKMKQSIVKVKKAIIGKSSSSKTVSTEGKDEIKVK